MRTAHFWGVFSAAVCVFLTACSSPQGWGVLLWYTEEPPLQSGTVLPVFIRSNIDKVWVLGLPGGGEKFEVPLSRFEFVGSRSKALRRAAEFSQYALVYAENLQNGLPIRDNPDNNARRVYRLRTGEIIKILSLAEGVPAISASGDPLPGDWYRVLAADGTVGYCFSYRLNIFEHHEGHLATSVPVTEELFEDHDLDVLMSKIWSPESYLVMVNARRFNLEELSRNWLFDPGQDTGIARINISGLERSFEYTAIRPYGRRAWRFEGTNLSMHLRSENVLAVQFAEGGGTTRTLLFASLPVRVEDIIAQETARRQSLYNAIFSRGPVFTSNNYGTIRLMDGGTFSWRGYDLLVPHIIPESADGTGTVLMNLFLSPALEDRYTGAFTMRLSGGGRRVAQLYCLYFLDDQGFRIEIVPESGVDDVTVSRRASSPVVLFFFRE